MTAHRSLPASHPLVAEWVDELASLGRSPRTVSGYTLDLGLFLAWLERDPLKATEADVRRYAHEMARAGLAERTRARRLAAVREWYRYLARTGRVTASPAEAVRPPKIHRRTPAWLSPDEVARLRAAIPGDPRGLRDRAAIELGLASLRISEALGLDLDDLFLDQTPPMVRIVGKGGHEYWQPLRQDTASSLKAWLEARPSCRSQAVFIPLPPRRRGNRLHYTTLEKALRRYLRAAGILRRIRFHDLRHTLGVQLGRAGVPLQHIQDLFRHRSPATTRIYTDLAPEHLAEVLEREGGFPGANGQGE
jgi:site-specific recombinase XerD